MSHLWIRQIRGVLRLELGKGLLSARAIPLYLLAALPVLLVVLVVLVALTFGSEVRDGAFGLERPGGIASFYAQLYQFILRFIVFAGCAWVFMNLFRGEVLDRSLHYYFLAPIRREVLVVGKFVSGWLCVTLLMGGATIGSLFLLHAYRGPAEAIVQLFGGPTWNYAAVTALACLGYGAVFLFAGLFLRNPIVPGLIFWLWESANPFLPALLKKISVIFYLQSLLPIRVAEGPFAIMAEPVAAWLAVPGLILFTVGTLAVAALRIRGMEIAYGLD